MRTVFQVMSVLAVISLVALVLANVTGNGQSEEVAYENESYPVPAEGRTQPQLPDLPTTEAEAYALLQDNPLYAQVMPEPVRCELPATGVEPWQMDADTLDTYFGEQVECLVRAWQPPTAAAGWTEIRPSVTVYSDQVTTECGNLQDEEAVNAFYCPADQGLYFSTLMFEFLPSLRTPMVAELVMAHEFGHNQQGRSNLLIPASLLQQQLDPDSQQEDILLISRQLELQADCFAGAFFASTATSLGLTEADYDSLRAALLEIGDDTLSGDPDIVSGHGHGDNRRLWGERGWSSTDLGTCNTFNAPLEELD